MRRARYLVLSASLLLVAASPVPFKYSGFIRAYDFTRQNASGFGQTFKSMNQASFNAAISLHATYQFSQSPFSVSATYLYANPGACVAAPSHLSTPCGKHTFTSQGAQPLNPDDTLPGFALSTLYEAYVQYKGPQATIRVGNQLIATPWANASDSRLKPAAFQGAALSYKIDAMWTAEAMYMARFESRASSRFDNATMLTSHPADGPGLAVNIFVPGGGSVTTSGFAYARLGYTLGNLTANAHYYGFTDIANALWFDAKYRWKSKLKPFVGVQSGVERQSGRGVIGKIGSNVFGLQAGITPVRNVDVTLSYNAIPERSDTLALPAGVTCGSNEQIKTAPGVSFGYFLPAGGTTNCVNNANGTATVYYGGWASPYTDSYATDPLFTTSISQGLADRRSAGKALKFAATYQSPDRRFRFIVSRAAYRYGNAIAGASPTQETDLDGTWYFRPPAVTPYHGFSFRYRYAERTQSNTQLYGGTPLFKYNRAQLEYDF